MESGLRFHLWSEIHFLPVVKLWGRVTEMDRCTLKLVAESYVESGDESKYHAPFFARD